MPSHKDWLLKANSDLKSIKLLLKGSVFDTAIYHAQQAAEKSLKAFLCYEDRSIIKTHDLTFLLKKCIELNSSFSIFTKEMIFLNPYASQFRYPDDYIFYPKKETVEEAFIYSKKIYNFVIKIIKELESGQKNIFY